MAATISEVLANPLLAAGDIILVHESAYSVAVAAGAPPNPNWDPLQTTYVENLVFPPLFDVTVKVDMINPGIGNVVSIQGTGTSSVVTFSTPLNTRNSLLDGFTITGGIGGFDDYINRDSGAIPVGGGIRCLGASPTIRNCTVEQNTAVLGAGIYASLGFDDEDPLLGPLIDSCTIRSNDATGPTFGLGPDGGGVYAVHCSPEIQSTTISNNAAEINGGGVVLYNELLIDRTNGDAPYGPLVPIQPVIQDSTIADNQANDAGGGVFAFVRVNALIERCSVLSNTASRPSFGGGIGGGFYWENCTMELITCDVRGNKAGHSGAGLQIDGEGLQGASPSSLTHCTIARNETIDPGVGTIGGGVGCSVNMQNFSGMTKFENCLIVNNEAGSGGGLHIMDASASFQNCTVSQNMATDASSDGFAGGVYYNQATALTGIQFQDSILDGNLYTQPGTPLNPWDVDFMAIGAATPPSITFCVMSKARQYLLFKNSPGNLVALPLFASGPALTHFPVNRFYLSHTPEQGTTSRAYNAGHTTINAMLAVDGMRCRTPLTSLLVDVGLVDIGFHYPNYPLVGQP